MWGSGVRWWGDGAADQTPLHPEAGLSLRGVVPWLARAEGTRRKESVLTLTEI